MDTLELLSDKLTRWAQEAVSALPNLALAVFIFVAFAISSRHIARLLCKGLHRVTDNEQVLELMRAMCRAALLALGAAIALRILKLEGAVTSLLAGIGVLGLALGFAFQDIAANFVSGVLLAIRRPFHVGDIIESNSYLGVVKSVDLRSTIVETFEGQSVTIPNKEVFGNPIVNYAKSGQRRVDLVIGVSYADDLERAEKVALEAVQDIEELGQRGAELFYEQFGASSVDFRLRLWVAPDQPQVLRARHEAVKRVRKAFAANDITIPFPIRTLDFGIEGGLPLSEVLSA